MDLIDFPWGVDRAGYEVRDGPIPENFDLPSEYEYKCRHVVGRSGTTKTIYPLRDNYPLFLDLWSAAPTEDGAVEFADRYGLIYGQDGLTIHGWESAVMQMRNMRKAARYPSRFQMVWNEFGVANFQLCLGPNLMPQLQPSNLLEAAQLQFVLHVAKGRGLHTCKQCGKPFVTGEGTNRRSKRKWCSDACSQKAYRQRLKA